MTPTQMIITAVIAIAMFIVGWYMAKKEAKLDVENAELKEAIKYVNWKTEYLKEWEARFNTVVVAKNQDISRYQKLYTELQNRYAQLEIELEKLGYQSPEILGQAVVESDEDIAKYDHKADYRDAEYEHWKQEREGKYVLLLPMQDDIEHIHENYGSGC